MKSKARLSPFAPALAALPLLCFVVTPAGAAPAGSSTDYNTQRTATKAVRYGGFSEVISLGRGAVGKTVEVAGEVKGVINHGTGFGVLLATSDGQMQMLDSPEFLRNNAALNLGATPRVLIKVEGVMGQTMAFTLVNATGEPDYARGVEDDPGAPVVLTPMNGTLVPRAGSVINNPAPNSAPALSAPRPPVAVQSGPTLVPDPATDPGQRQLFKSLAQRYNPRLDDNMADYISTSLISAASSQNLDPRFLAAVVSVESSFDPNCVSSSGALGLGQLMPFNLRGLGISNAYDPMQNLNGSARMLRNNLNRFANQTNSTLLAVAAYHAGGNAVVQAGYTVPNKPATQRYVWKVYYAYKALAPELFN